MEDLEKFVSLEDFTKGYSDYFCVIYRKKTFKTNKCLLYFERKILIKTRFSKSEKIKDILDWIFKEDNKGFFFQSEVYFCSFTSGNYYVFEI